VLAATEIACSTPARMILRAPRHAPLVAPSPVMESELTSSVELANSGRTARKYRPIL